MERWLPIEDFPGYEVSDHGRVRSWIARSRLLPKEVRPWLSNGYHHIKLARDKKKYHVSVHRLVALAFIDNPENFPHIAHRDGSRANNHVGNLRWTNQSGNEMDKVQHGRSNRGERHGMSKLTADQVREIRRLACAMTQRQIAELYGISQPQVWEIVNRQAWHWLD